MFKFPIEFLYFVVLVVFVLFYFRKSRKSKPVENASAQDRIKLSVCITIPDSNFMVSIREVYLVASEIYVFSIFVKTGFHNTDKVDSETGESIPNTTKDEVTIDLEKVDDQVRITLENNPRIKHFILEQSWDRKSHKNWDYSHDTQMTYICDKSVFEKLISEEKGKMIAKRFLWEEKIHIV